MAKQKSKPHLQDKNSLFVEAERAHSGSAPKTETTATLDSAKAPKRDKSARPKGRSRH